MLDTGGGTANRADMLCVVYRLMSGTLLKSLRRSYSLVYLSLACGPRRALAT